MSEIEEMRAAVRRRINPLDTELLRAAETLVTGLAARSGDVNPVMEGNSSSVSLFFSLYELAEQRFLMSDGHNLSHQEYAVLPKSETLSLVRMLMRPLAEPYSNPPLKEPTEEDGRRLADLVSVRGGAEIGEILTFAPSWDKFEAREWITAAALLGGITIDGDRLMAGCAPASVDLVIENLGGNCPVQAEGRMNGVEFYYRARGETQSVETDDGFFMDERVAGGPYAAGWIEDETAREFINRAALAHARHVAASEPFPSNALSLHHG